MPTSSGVLVCPRVVGRALELAALNELVGAAVNGIGGAVALVGEAGVGKSRLVREVGAQARRRGLVVGLGRGSQTSDAPYRVLSEALISAARAAGRPDGPAAGAHRGQLGRLVPAWSADHSPVDITTVGLGEAVLAAAAALGSGFGILLILEDVHWADEETLDVVSYLADNLADSPIGLLITSRPTNPRSTMRLRALAGRASLIYLEAGQLDRAGAREMTAACLESAPGDVPEEVYALVCDRSDGLPLLVEDLVASLLRSGQLSRVDRSWDLAPANTAPPARFADLVSEQLRSLDPDSRLVIEAASLLGADFDWRLLADICQVPPQQVGASLRAAGRAQLVTEDSATTSFSFRHALTADVIGAEMPAQRRASLSGRAADALARTGHEGAMPAGEARLRATAGEADRAARLYCLAAETAARRGALAAAEGYLRSALTLAPGAAAAERQLLEVLVHRGRSDEALHLGAGLADRMSAGERPGVHLLMARACISRGDVVRAREQLSAARTTTRPAELAEIAVLDAQSALVAVDRDRLVAAEHLARRAAVAARDAAEFGLLCEALEIAGRCARVRDLTAASTAFGEALDVATGHDLELWRIRALNELGTVDMFREVDPARLRSARDAAAAVGALVLEGGAEVNLAAVLTMRGEHSAARHSAERAEALGRRCHAVPLIAAGLVFRGVVATHQGRFADMQGHVRSAEAIAGDDPDVIVGTWAMCRGVAALLREDHAAARHAFETAAARIADLPALAISPVAGPWLLLRATDGDLAGQEVARYQAEQPAGARWSQLWGELAAAVVLAGAGDTDGACRCMERGIHAAAPMPLFRAIGVRLACGVAARDGWGDPVGWLTPAAATFDRFGHERSAAACRTLLRRAGGRVPRARAADAVVPPRLRAHGVTRRELEVLELVAERIPNREVATRLFLSPRTVEKHVASLLGKLGAEGRDDLIRMSSELLTRE